MAWSIAEALIKITYRSVTRCLIKLTKLSGTVKESRAQLSKVSMAIEPREETTLSLPVFLSDIETNGTFKPNGPAQQIQNRIWNICLQFTEIMSMGWPFPLAITAFPLKW